MGYLGQKLPISAKYANLTSKCAANNELETICCFSKNFVHCIWPLDMGYLGKKLPITANYANLTSKFAANNELETICCFS